MTRSVAGANDASALGRRSPFVQGVVYLFCAFAALTCLGAGIPALAKSGTNLVRVVTHDPGGQIDDRAREIARLMRQGARVELRGGCWSACTMYLALPGTCVSPGAVLGFHGPASTTYGLGLSPDVFERASRLMADHYPEPLRSWFLRKGRNVTVGFYRFSGVQLIEMGIPKC